MKPNVRLRSNVYIRTAEEIRYDRAFRDQVRGHKAIRQMVARFIPYQTSEVLSEKLTPWQLHQYYERECPFCLCQVYGPVRRQDGIVYVWKRPPKYCECWKSIE